MSDTPHYSKGLVPELTFETIGQLTRPEQYLGTLEIMNSPTLLLKLAGINIASKRLILRVASWLLMKP